MPESDRINSCLNEIELDFVKQEATPSLFMKLDFSTILQSYYFRIQFLCSRYSVLNERVRPFTTGFTKPIYSPGMDEVRITLRSTRL